LPTADAVKLSEILKGVSRDPFAVLGMHHVTEGTGKAKKKCVAIRAYLPRAEAVTAKDAQTGETFGLSPDQGGEGLFEAVIKDRKEFFRYTLEITFDDGGSFTTADPYCFKPTVSEHDAYLFNEGRLHGLYGTLGAHPTELEGFRGTRFCVWAPNAKRVSVVGDFNGWDGRRHQMRMIGLSGLWEIFVPLVGEGDRYKYEIHSFVDTVYLKSDPVAFQAERPPRTASVVCGLGGYEWGDGDWMERREGQRPHKGPMSIYEVHLGSWARTPEGGYLSYADLASGILRHVLDMGYTHIELMPVCEHPFDGSWGYQVTGFFAATSRYGTPWDFMAFVDGFHRAGIGVILDWVPAHFPKDAAGLARFDGTALYEHHDWRLGEHRQWGTHVFNFGRREVRDFLVSNALFWLEAYHLDGLRVDAVSTMLYLDHQKRPGEWLPNKWGGKENLDAIEFLRELNVAVFGRFKGVIMAAEESTAWGGVTRPTYLGGLGFSFKWNMGWMNDFLKYLALDPIHRKYNHNLVTFSIMYAMDENFILVLSHDEVVHGKRSMLEKVRGDYWQRFATVRAAYAFMFGHPGKKLLFMGNDIGHFIEWNYAESLDWHLLGYEMHGKFAGYMRELLHMYKDSRPMYEMDGSYEGFEWIDCNNADDSVVSFMRMAEDRGDLLVFICNFTPVVHRGYRVGLPRGGRYVEALNSDDARFGGSGVTNGDVWAEGWGIHGRAHSAAIDVPPLGAVILRPA